MRRTTGAGVGSRRRAGRRPANGDCAAYRPCSRGRSVIVVTENCGADKSGYGEVLAFDSAGRRLVHISRVATYEDRVVGDSLLFLGGNAATGIGVLRYDFVTGSLSRLGPAQEARPTRSHRSGRRRALVRPGRRPRRPDPAV